jgi:F-type H+-transporting ATPase subunit epsilon
MNMQLQVLVPSQVFLDEEVTKVVAEAGNGSFCLLPRHVDFVASLVPGLLSFQTIHGQEEFLAIDEGVLVKSGQSVTVSTRNAVRGADLGQLRRTVERQFRALGERDRLSRNALAKLEASFVRRFLELGGPSHG